MKISKDGCRNERRYTTTVAFSLAFLAFPTRTINFSVYNKVGFPAATILPALLAPACFMGMPAAELLLLLAETAPWVGVPLDLVALALPPLLLLLAAVLLIAPLVFRFAWLGSLRQRKQDIIGK